MDGVYQLVFGGNNANGEYGENVFHHKVTGTSGSDDAYKTAKALGAAWYAAVVADLEPLVGSDVQLNILNVRKIDGSGGPSAFVAIAGLGTATHPSGTFASAVDLRLIPDQTSPRSGHWFMWGLPWDAWATGLLTPFIIGLLSTFANDLLIPLNVLGGTSNLVIWKKKTHVAVPVDDIAIQDDRATGMNKRTIPVL